MNINLNPLLAPKPETTPGFVPFPENGQAFPQQQKKSSGWVKVHPTNPLSIAGIQYEILKRSDLPVMKKLQQVSRNWKKAVDDKAQWQLAGSLLHLPATQCDQDQVKNFIKQTKAQAKLCFYLFSSYFFPKSSLQEEIDALISSNKIEDINTLREACKARDAIIFWRAAQMQGNIGHNEAPEIEQNSVKELLSQAKGLSNWCQNYQAELSQLRLIDISISLLTSLPAEIGMLTQLQKLILLGNQLTSLPAEIGMLTQLQKLDLGFNQLTSLPAEIGMLTQLQELLLRNNKLTSLPAQIGMLTQLQELDLSFNQLTSLPAEIGMLTQLQKLDLRGNELTSAPEEIRQLNLLKRLYILGNPLISLPVEIWESDYLQDRPLLLIEDKVRNLFSACPFFFRYLDTAMHLQA